MCLRLFFFFFNDTATTEIYTLSLHDALPISPCESPIPVGPRELQGPGGKLDQGLGARDRKSTRLNSSHTRISYAVCCLKKKTTPRRMLTRPGPPGREERPWRRTSRQ